MGSSNTIRAIFVAILIVLGIYGLYPSFQYYSMTEEERQAKQESLDPEYLEMKQNILNLGLDLQGGMQLTVEIDVEKFLLRSMN